MYVKEDDGWKFAYHQGTSIYNGPFTDSNLYQRYAGTYVLRAGRMFKLDWNGGALMATGTNGSRQQIFLKSPTETTTENYLFVLDCSGRPSAVRLMRGDTEVWRAERKEEGGVRIRLQRDARDAPGLVKAQGPSIGSRSVLPNRTGRACLPGLVGLG